jgi:hypothetical protein
MTSDFHDESMLGGSEWRGYIDLVCRRAALAGRAPTRLHSTLVEGRIASMARANKLPTETGLYA